MHASNILHARTAPATRRTGAAAAAAVAEMRAAAAAAAEQHLLQPPAAAAAAVGKAQRARALVQAQMCACLLQACWGRWVGRAPLLRFRPCV